MNNEPVAPAPRWLPALVVVASALLGVACFIAGRLSAPPMAPAPLPPVAAQAPAPTPLATAPAATPLAAGPAPASASPEAKWSRREWERLVSQPGTTARNAAMAALLEQLAVSDPSQALGLAQGEANLKLREPLLHAVLRGWARSAPIEASNWALTMSNPSERSRAIEAVFGGLVAARPEEAVRVAKAVIDQAPGGSVGYGSTLIDALCDAGHFDMAAQFAAKGAEGDRSFWLGEAYSKWAALQPEQAAQAAAAIADPAIRNQALHGVVGGWAEANPAALSDFIAQLPADAERGSMLGQALRSWVQVDAGAAATWINNHEVNADLDEGVKAVASMDLGGDSFPPAAALSWAESIINEKLRSEALVGVVRDWVHTDLPAAKQFFDTTTHLLPADRKQLAEIIADASKPPQE